eukprot:CAMPEP_0185018268 /NCGR_PEP_ID=MMETSP1103-20130426/1045_1 /TAXON_ID=36769 /ORGANISM="Paraphysomonas bandaiensis, Strain Caron Lab Isolate" /LENGTH=614 /DNA_ID=CAMNT_0027548019 /DNA_START=367 /DNA_END=2212 /DNA_ORIENTATION=+
MAKYYYGGGDKRDVNYDLYIFHVDNPVEALNGERPVLVQLGPYAFKQYFNKYDIKWMDDGDTVQYRLQNFYLFDEENTGPGLRIDDNVTIPYASALGFEYLLQEIPIETEDLLDAAVEDAIDSILDAILAEIEIREQAVKDNPFMSDERKNETLATLESLANLVEIVEQGVEDYLAEASAGSSLLKLILCTALPGEGVSMFWQTDPVSAYFGWLNDPLKMVVQDLIDYLNLTDAVPWDTSVPGATTNYTSEADSTRRRDINIQKTGKRNLKEVGKFVRANNQTTQYVCVYPMDSQDPNNYTEGKEFPWCEPFQLEWNQSTAESKGYVLVFATDYANRIAGTDANLFGAPANTEKLQVYVNDIYRTSYVKYEKDVGDWHGVNLRRYKVQLKDSWNSTLNPTEGWQYYNDAPSGMQNLTAVATLPLFISKPHFLDADPSLVASVRGLTPSTDAHDTYLDVEPNTGALCRVMNRVQVLYQLNSMNLPEVNGTTAAAAEGLCAGLVYNNFTNSSCDGLDTLMQCLAVPSDWRVYNDRVYVPYSWIEQSSSASSDDAKSIKEGLYQTDEYAAQIQLWCYVSAGFLAMMVLGMYIARYIMRIEEADKQGMPRPSISCALE